MSQLRNPKRKIMQRLAWFFIVLIVNQIAFPATVLALTSGPSQPEVQSFQPVGTTDMVNLFSGDFSYNIPLFEVPGPDGGYPVNLFYNSVTDANEEASWTGLGWNINVGSLSRSMRGLPDDFDGEEVTRKLDMLKNETVVAGVTGSLEIGGYDEIDEVAKGVGLSLSLTTNYTYNSYRGAGFSIDPMIGLKGSFSGKSGGTYSPNLSLGLNLSSTSAASLNTSFSMSVTKDNVSRGFNFGLSFNGREGLSSMSLGYSQSKSGKREKSRISDKKVITGYNPAGGGVNASYSFARTSYTPEVKIPWTGWNLAGSFSFAPGAAIVYGTFGFSGSYSVQEVQNGGTPIPSKAYGYNYLQNALEDGKSLMDFNREKDGAVHRHNRFLATPSLSYDIYNVVGQGIGGMYRAHRSDYGFVHDPTLFANTGGGSIGGQVGPYLKVGVDASFNYSQQENSRWPMNAGYFGNRDENYSFKSSEKGAAFENVYYKTAGEMAAEPLDAYNYMGGDKPLRLKKNDKFQYDGTNGGILEAKEVKVVQADPNDPSTSILTQSYEPIIKFDAGESKRENRRPRNIGIQNISNNDLLGGNGNEILPEYNIQYYDGVGTYDLPPSRNLDRTPNEQNAGFTATGIDGVRWVYGLPIQNHVQKEAIFSVEPVDDCSKRVFVPSTPDDEIDYKVDGTHKYIDEKTIPEYAHSYLLTSVLGSDYVDIDNTPGPSEGDVGYWMKTNYVKLSNDYQWRAPFFGANLIQGFENTRVDDMGTFMWGSREVYLPATIETKTHIAYFEMSERKDAKGATGYVQNAIPVTPLAGASSYKLDKIKLYSKKEINAKGLNDAVPLKVVNLSYDYSLCKGVENNVERTSTDPLKGGKLTLKKVWFTYENSTRGAISPYVFKYENANHDYDDNAMDRWGAYKALPSGDACANLHNPYTEQFSEDASFKENLNNDIAAWHLSQIIMPSGATMNIELERDDYAYVQDAVATQMQPVFALGITDQGEPDVGGFLNNDVATGQAERRVYFKLEEPLFPTETDKLKKYIEDLPLVKRFDKGDVLYKQVYFKTYSNLKTAGTNNEVYEYVTGYAEIEKDNDGQDIIAFDNNSPLNVDGAYTEAYITLMTSRKQVKGNRYHPMIMANWDFLKNNLPDKMFGINQDPDPENAMPQIAGMGAGFAAIFLGYYGNAKDKDFGRIIDVSKSFIKLNTPDKIKYGGGARVKKITMEDNWTPEEDLTNTLGVVYDYTIKDEDGNTYSSGVMENETTIGYDACALKYADITEEIQGGKVKDIHIYEYPMNEGMYPGSGVGYSQVTVRSLASDYALQASQASDRTAFLADNNLPDGFGTTGQVVHQFYTAKDFPVVTDRTDLDDKETEPWLSLLSSFLMMTRRDQYTGTQGYSIELNNMHGQSKAQISYAQDNTGKVLEDKPLTKVSYEYQSKTRNVKARGIFKTINVLDNEVRVLMGDNPNSHTTLDANTPIQLVGVDYDFVMDGRQSTSTSASTGAAVNIDVTGIYPVPFPWPKFNLNSNETRLAVTNKIINRRGIMMRTHAFDGQSHIITSNEVFDKYTGQPLLTYTNNQLGGGIYSYTVPAYLAHSQLGMAAKNAGMKFTAQLQTAINSHEFIFSSPDPANILAYLIPGDEYLISDDNQGAKSRAIYLGDNIFSLENLATFTVIPGVDYNFYNVRSGNKNMLSASIAQYSTVRHADAANDNANPLKGRVSQTCSPNFVEIEKQPVVNAQSGLQKNVITLNYLLKPGIKQQWANIGSGSVGASHTLRSLGLDCDYCIFWNQNLTGNASGVKSNCNSVGHNHFFSPTTSYESISSGVILEDLYRVEILSSVPSPVGQSIVRFYMNNSLNGDYYIDKSLLDNDPSIMKPISCSNILNEATVEVATHSTTVQHKTINQVLSASANAYSDEWNVEHYDHCLEDNIIQNNSRASYVNNWHNLYRDGKKGVWRAKSTYTYVKDRNFVTYNPNGASLEDVDIKNSGLVDNVPLFNWNNPYFEYCDHNWIRTEDVTKYNLGGAAVEARDILGNYQAELYAYNDNVVTAKGVNTQYYEMGFEGFEEPNATGTIHDLAALGHYNNGNLDFLPFTNCANTIVKRQENYHLCYPTKVAASGNTAYILVRKPYDQLSNINLSEISLSLTNGTTKIQVPTTASVEAYPVSLNAGDHFQIPGLAPALDETTKEQFTIYEVALPSGIVTTMNSDWWAGDATLIFDQDLAAANSVLPQLGGAQFSAEEAHTGKYSLQLAMGINTLYQFPQNTLHLQVDKDYIFSAWVNVTTTFGGNTTIKHTYDNGNLEIRMGGTLMQPKGAIIEGWQRVEGKFTYTGNNNLTFLDNTAVRIMFVDDVRIYPADANMQSYVYDPINYRLKATLDNNNYATFYVYDEDGSLILLKRETEKGVKTIQESRSYVKPNGQ